jgi:hypothetical protein
LVTPLQYTAIAFFVGSISLRAKNYSRLKCHHLADADERGKNADYGDGGAGEKEQFPGETKGELRTPKEKTE